ncbi:uncharacterized protein LOC111019603 [Momordica charantia]|uniref:Uncharacterized protein LOC111019603 n=1 Tax=Momordica charantia TaxID=3673 RepID=A0A6J1DCW8_MOMCH|nr:uncharacterized protein LOC111019603 [Momordica charantia]
MQRGDVIVTKITAEHNIADPLTKALTAKVALLGRALQALIDNSIAAGAAQALQPRQALALQSEAQFIRDFRRYGPPTFNGESEKATVVEEWIRELEALYTYLGCSDQLKVKGAVFMLRGEALNWWDVVATVEDHTNEPITWTTSKDLLYDYYFPKTIKDEKEIEFLHLTQRTLMVAQYEKKFTEFSRFALDLIPTEARKIKRFVRGLWKGIKGPIDLQRPTTYAEAIKGALVMDKDVIEKAQPQQKVGLSSGVKRKVPPISSSQPSKTSPQQ